MTGAAEALGAEGDSSGPTRGRKRPWLIASRLIFGLLVLAAVIAVVSHLGDARRFAEVVRRARPSWLLLAVALQTATYFCAGGIWWLVLRRLSSPQPLRTLVLLSVGKLFTDQTVPAGGVAGSVLMVRGVGRRGTPVPAANAALTVGLLGFYAAMIVATAASLLTLWTDHHANAALVAMTAVLLMVAAVVSVGLVAMVRGDDSPVRRWLARIGPLRKLLDSFAQVPPHAVRDPVSLSGSLSLQLANIALDAATLQVMLAALGEHVAPSSVLASFVFASIAEMTGLSPGGLGTFEGTCVALLHVSGVGLEVALAATLLLRGFTFWLPMAPGMAIVRRELGSEERRRHNAPTHDGPNGEPRAPRRSERAESIASMTIERAFATLHSAPTGLDEGEAQRRLATVGPNEVAAHRGDTVGAQVLRRLGNPLILILMFASIVSAFTRDFANAAIILAMVVVSIAMDVVQTRRSTRAAEALKARVAQMATALRNQAYRELPTREIVPGDVVRLTAGDMVPADARLLAAKDLHVNEAALTGESLPVEKTADRADACTLFMGSSVVSGTGTALVFATGSHTAFGDIAQQLARRPPPTEFERGMARFGTFILKTVVLLVLFVFVVTAVRGRDPLESLLFAVALAVGITPEGLPMITTITLTKGALRMARTKVIVKNLAAIQNFGSIDVLCSDKTGTLTTGQMSLDVHVDPLGTASDRPLLLAYMNSYFESGVDNPLDAAVLSKAKLNPLDSAVLRHERPDISGFEKVDEIPFDFERRRLSVVVRRATDVLLVTKGAPEDVLAISTTYEVDAQRNPLDQAARARIAGVYEALGREGYRVLGVASARLQPRASYSKEDEHDLSFAGFIAFVDPPRPDAADTLLALRKQGVHVKVLTGDSEHVAAHLCERVGLHTKHLLTGSEIDAMSDPALVQRAVQTPVFARVSPAQKTRILLALRARDHVVGFLGDGINDAPSLHAADVGISVTNAVDVAKDAAEIILLAPDLRVLLDGVLEGRKAFGNVMKYLLMGTSSNFGNMLSMAGAAVVLPFLPMTPSQILLNNLLYDAAQFTIPTDRVDDSLVRKPRRWDINVIRRVMLLLGPISSLYDFLTFYVLIKVFHADEALFHTGWFVESLATQTLVIFVIRTASSPLKSRPSVPLATTTLAVVAVAAALPFTPLARPFGFVPLPAPFFFFLVVATGTYLLLVEIAKRVLFRKLLA